MALVLALGGGWIWGASGKAALDHEKRRVEERLHFETARSQVLDGRLTLVGNGYAGASASFKSAAGELGGVFGVAVLASIFAHYGGYGTGQSFVDGLTPAIWVGAVVVVLGALAALMIPGRRRHAEVEVLQPALDEAA